MNGKTFLFICCLVASLLMISTTNAIFSRECDLTINLVNQDPNPAFPREEIKVLFQLIGTENQNCGDLAFKIFEEFPFTVHPKYPSRQIITTGTFTPDYQSFFTLPYTLRIDKDASEGEIELKVGISQNPNRDSYVIQKFNITIQEAQTEFEIYVRDYNAQTQNIVFEVLNIGNADADSLVIEIPEQENIILKGRNANIIGILDSNDYATASFNAFVNEGELSFILTYNDETDIRRIAEINTSFNPLIFQKEQESRLTSNLFLFFTALLFLIIIQFMKKKQNKKIKLLEKRYNSK
jgi:hypothetical protein